MNKNTFGIFANIIITSSFLLAPLLSSAQAATSITEDLYLGLQNSQVLLLQQILQQLGDFPATVKPTGYFGLITETAVKVFQTRNNILVDGVPTGYVGPRTREALAPVTDATDIADVSCVDATCPDASEPASDVTGIPIITSIDTPYTSGVGVIIAGKTAYIHGTGLSGSITVKVGSKSVDTTSDNDTLASFTVPTLPAGPASVSVVLNNASLAKSNSFRVFVLPFALPGSVAPPVPVISSRSPSVAPGGAVNINGTNFARSAMVVIDGNTAAPIVPFFQNSTSLGFVVPPSTVAGTHTLQITQEGGTVSVSVILEVTTGTAVSPTISITTSALPGVGVGRTYSTSIAISGGNAPPSVSVSSGTIPDGVMLGNPVCSDVSCSKATVGLSGTPTTAGVYSFTITAMLGTQTVSKAFVINVSSGYVYGGTSGSGLLPTCPTGYSGTYPNCVQNTVGTTAGTCPPYTQKIFKFGRDESVKDSNGLYLPSPNGNEGQGAWVLALFRSGLVAPFILPDVTAPLPGQLAGEVGRISWVDHPAWPMGAHFLDVSFSKCPGDMTGIGVPTGQTYSANSQIITPCRLSKSEKRVLAWSIVGKNMMVCYLPKSDGPWYANLRLNYTETCYGGATLCGPPWQWNGGGQHYDNALLTGVTVVQ